MRLPITPLTTLQRGLRDEVRRWFPAGRVIVGVDGVDGSGKTAFADSLAGVFAEDGSAVYRASMDDFHRPRSERYALGRRSPEGFYRDSYDEATFRRVLIDPFRDTPQTSGTAGFQLAAFDLARDAPVDARWTTAPKDAVLVVDGIFLNRPSLAEIWDETIWLDVPWDIAYARMAARDGIDPDPEAPSNARWRGGMQLYLDEVHPREAASVVIDNSDLAHPKRVAR
jgi:uridine kinase